MHSTKYLTYSPIDLTALMSRLHSPSTGALVLFSGEVRNINKGREVSCLEYEAYIPMAEKTIDLILKTAIDKWKLNDAICVHRLGELGISDCAVVVITAAMHRAEAYDANRYIIDRVKLEAPIWKKEFFADGSYEWGNNAECNCMPSQLAIPAE